MTDTTERAREFLLESVNDPTEEFAQLVRQGAYDTTAEFRMAKRVLDALSAPQPMGEDAVELAVWCERKAHRHFIAAAGSSGESTVDLRNIDDGLACLERAAALRAAIAAMPHPASTVEAGDALREARAFHATGKRLELKVRNP